MTLFRANRFPQNPSVDGFRKKNFFQTCTKNPTFYSSMTKMASIPYSLKAHPQVSLQLTHFNISITNKTCPTHLLASFVSFGLIDKTSVKGRKKFSKKFRTRKNKWPVLMTCYFLSFQLIKLQDVATSSYIFCPVPLTCLAYLQYSTSLNAM